MDIFSSPIRFHIYFLMIQESHEYVLVFVNYRYSLKLNVLLILLIVENFIRLLFF